MPPYSTTVLDHFHDPRNVGRMEAPDRVGRAGIPGRGNFVILYLRLAGERIDQASFQTYGCCPAIAACSYLTSWLAGKTLAEARALTEPALREALGGLPRRKRHCTRLAIAALRAALSADSIPPPGASRSPSEAPHAPKTARS